MNLIVFNLPESVSVNNEDRKKEDRTMSSTVVHL